ncbi:uncharacterized protein BDZ99DRAFT_434508 [Mytilinidion resinicola]|uniref:Cytochrome b561 domain-containing protein n=1 Tax=Mytilinidion resinicola TaxID=574789 RepID=A0A6A6Z1X2_9PEZI|nr:uncharacterized protein BDZ99DRAFT_434508 [Mytilinidion resinicola]KAF2814719.1 hypothetical protein BDZ99DRAFT_434508 [Mytilinidion resinicola]
MANPALSAPGSSVYASDTMYVGDGTWDSSRNTFLLPNLQGLNLATTQYNGMGNRFKNMPGYHNIIKGHAIVAAITFLGVIPAAIFIARFYHRNPRLALRLHIWLQILTVALSTVVFILGFQAVGLKRSLTNPHHGIGVAIYTLILIQAFAGGCIHRSEKGKNRTKIPLKLMLHQWFGRAIAILGVIQVALGLTLYGSPKTLFILYAIWGFVLLAVYFILTYRNQPEIGFNDRGTYISERTERTERSRHGKHRGLKALAGAGALGAGLAALRRRSRSRSRSRSRTRPGHSRPDVIGSHRSSRHSESFVDEEKYAEDGHRNGKRTWRDRILGAAAAGGAIAAVRGLMGRKKRDDDHLSDVSYGRPLGGNHSVSQTDLSRIEEGLPPESPANDRRRRFEEHSNIPPAVLTGSPLRQTHRPRRSEASFDSYDSRTSFSGEDARHDGGAADSGGHGLRNGILGLGVLGFARHKWNQRKNKRDEERVEAMRQEEIEKERIARANSNRRHYTGDGAPARRGSRRGSRPPPPESSVGDYTDITGTNPALSRHTLPPPPMNFPGSRTNVTNPQMSSGGLAMPPAPHDPQAILHDSGSEAYTSAGGGRHHRHHAGRDAALAAGAAGLAGAAVASSSRPGRNESRRRSSNSGSVASPPVSVKVKMHNDGRHVTLRRLGEEEAAAERERKRRNNRAGSVSSLSNTGDERWRRTEAMETAQARQEQQQQQQQQAPIRMPEPTIPGPPPIPPPPQMSHASQEMFIPPPPPPIPAAAASGVSSPPGTQTYGTETDVSNYESNRRRRRAERAQAKLARGSGSRVEFS